jgi:hypothetical protein
MRVFWWRIRSHLHGWWHRLHGHRVGTTGNVYTAGTKVRISVTFTDANNAPLDPGTVTLKYVIAGATFIQQTYNPGNVIRDGVGLYHYDLDTTIISTVTQGLLTYEWLSTGTGQAIVVGSFVISPAPI